MYRLCANDNIVLLHQYRDWKINRNATFQLILLGLLKALGLLFGLSVILRRIHGNVLVPPMQICLLEHRHLLLRRQVQHWQ